MVWSKIYTEMGQWWGTSYISKKNFYEVMMYNVANDISTEQRR